MYKEIKQLSHLKETVDGRLREFKEQKQWFSELCFCLLTANSRAHTAIAIQKEIGERGFMTLGQQELANTIKRNKHRFHNNKAKFIVEARKHKDIRKILEAEKEPREWLVSNVKGLGMKEASHFLRNVGYENYAILDRHILNIMDEHGIIKRPKTLTKKNYLEIEQKFAKIAAKMKMNLAELDLYMWYLKTGEILK